MQNNFGIQGLTYAGQTPPEPPVIVVVAKEKVGKSALTLSLFDYPNPGDQPLVLAFDASGPDSCAQLSNRPVAVIKVGQQPGSTFIDQTRFALDQIENCFRSQRHNFTSIVVDCASTMTARFFNESASKKTNKQQAYGDVLDWSSNIMWRLIELGVPTIWLSWLKEPYVEEKNGKIVKTHMGGPQMTGNFRGLIGGKATQILYLEKFNGGPNNPNADGQGYVRQIHTRPVQNINCDGRYSFKLPEPCPPDLGYVLRLIGTPNATQAPAAGATTSTLPPPNGAPSGTVHVRP